MRFGSLFSGIGGLDLGLERAGMECAWQVENDPYATRVLEKHWPNVMRYGDIREVDFGGVGRVDLVCGGFPCQDLSLAGRGAGLAGAKSGLWSEYVRAIRMVRPRFVLVENVLGLLSRGMGTVVGELALLGYDCEWESIPAHAFGAPHLRKRVFVVAYAQRAERRQGKPAGNEPDRENARWPQEASGLRASGSHDGGRTLDHADGGRHGVPQGAVFTGRASPQLSGWWATEPNVGRVAHGIPHRVDRLRGLGNAVAPQVAEWIGRRIMEAA